MMFNNLFSDAEKTAMVQYINQYAPYETAKSTKVLQPESLEKVLTPWLDAKSQFLYKLFGERLIYEEEIEILTPVDKLYGDYSDAVASYRHTDASRFITLFRQKAIDANLDISKFAIQDFLLSKYSLMLNKYIGSKFSIKDKNGKEIVINPEEKTSKAIGKIAKALGIDEDLYEAWRLEHSKILNSAKAKGTLCLSIHPLDYMTMSHNDCDWTSCMNWPETGCYRQGTVEMMNSNIVVVAYIKSNKDMYLTKDFIWNNKRWRKLFIVSPDLICGIKGYPFQWDEVDAKVIQILSNLAKSNLNINFEKEIQYWNGDYPTIQVQNRTKYIHFTTDIMYNDFYVNHPLVISDSMSTADETIKYSGPNECMICGEIYPEFIENDDGDVYDKLTCKQCEYYRYCDYCKSRITNLSDFYTIDGEEICESCYDNLTHKCAVTGALHLEYNLKEYKLINSSDHILGKIHIEINLIPKIEQQLSGKIYRHFWSNESIQISDMTKKEFDKIFPHYAESYIDKENFKKNNEN